MKYFFLSDGWTVGRVWEFGGLWNEAAWRRKPEIHQTSLSILQQDEKMWLYRVEDDVIMLEVKPPSGGPENPKAGTIGQVMIKRLITGDQVIELLCKAATGLNPDLG